jgi:hypothetical protein
MYELIDAMQVKQTYTLPVRDSDSNNFNPIHQALNRQLCMRTALRDVGGIPAQPPGKSLKIKNYYHRCRRDPCCGSVGSNTKYA